MKISGYSMQALSWKTLKVGGGGFTRDLDIADDGTLVCKIDVFGGYVWNSSAPSTGNAGGTGIWQLLTKPGPIPNGDPAFSFTNMYSHASGDIYNFYESCGVFEIRIAPSNSNVIYMLWAGMMYKSSNKGVTFVNQTDNAGGTFPRQTAAHTQSNVDVSGTLNGAGPPMAIDPQNPDVCWFGDIAGVFYTQDGGTTWNTLSTSKLPLPTPSGYGCYGFAFDRASAVSGGKTQGIYCFVSDTGVYYSSDAGANWTLLSGGSYSGTMPTVNVKIVVDKFGGAWVTSDQRSSVGSNNLFNFTVHAGTAFTQNTWALSSANSTFGFVWAVAPDPASSTSTAQRVIIFDDSGQIAQSTDGGSTWTPKQSRASLVANDIPWLATNEAGDLTLDGTPKFDHSNNLFYPQGIGVWKANLPTVGDGSTWPAWNWVSQTAGIESLQTIDIICPPGGYVCTAQWDRNLFVIDNSSPDATPFPSTYGTRSGQATILPGQGIDWSGGTPAFLGIQSDGAEDSFSTTKGFPAISGWSRQAHHPTGPSDPFGPGGMAVSTSTSMIVVAGNLYATTDGGATAWTDVTPSGTAGAWPNGSGQTSMYVAADKVTANYYVANNGYDIYYTSNTGGSWTKVTPGFSLSTTSTNGHTIRAVPYNSKHYFFTSGASNQSIDTTNLFYRTTDGGPTWADVSNGSYSICDVYAFGFGAPSQSYPTIFIYGSVNGVLGVWASIDNCATWQKIGDQQFNGITFDVITSMNGDMNVPGVVYVALFGSGYIQLNY